MEKDNKLLLVKLTRCLKYVSCVSFICSSKHEM